MKRLVLAALAALLLSALAACGMAVKEVAVWRAMPSFYLTTGSAVRSETVRVDSSLSELDAAAEAFGRDTDDPELERALPDGVELLGWELAGGELRLSVSPEYAALTGWERTVADCCAVLTFCAVDGVDSVSVYSEGTLLSAAMEPEDFLLADAAGLEE